MRKILMALSLAAVIVPTTAALADPPPWAPAHGKRAQDWKHNKKQARHYESGRYYADRHYRDGRYYQPRRLGYDDRIYRGADDRYYCRRSDGTTGLIIGAALGGLLGREIDRGGSRTLGTLAGAGAGALLGREIARGELKCR
jgi:hypothetical protein